MADFTFASRILPGAPIPLIVGPVPPADLVNVLNNVITQINQIMVAGLDIAPTTTIAALPATGLTPGQRAFVSNGTVATGFGVVPAAAGAVLLPVYADTVTTWKYG